MATAFQLDAETLQALDDLVATGRWADRDEALRQSVSSFRQQCLHEDVGVEVFTPEQMAAIEEGIAQADRGELIPAEEVFDRLTRRYAEWK